MSKLPKEYRFLDLSDYGRPIAKVIANFLKSTKFTAVDVTIAFIISGLLATIFIIRGDNWFAASFLILKSILDAADGELARVKNSPSYTGRYLDSVADITLNAIFILAIWYISETSIVVAILAFIGIQLQGTLYNYYYVILRNRFDGDTTSRVIESETPVAFPNEKQEHVDLLFGMYTFLYGIFDRAIYLLDPKAEHGGIFPNWLMSCISTFGLGFQLLIMAVMLVLQLEDSILPFFVLYSLMIFVFIIIRRVKFK